MKNPYRMTMEPQSTVEEGIYPDMLANFDKLAYSFANIFNKVHSLGHNLEWKAGSSEFFRFADGSTVDFTDKE